MVQIRAAETAADRTICACVTGTGVATASAVEWAVVCFVSCVAQFQIAKASEQCAVARIACGHDAVKHVHTLRHTFHQIFRCANAHQIARLVRGQTVRCVRHDAQHFVFGFAHTHAAHGIAGKIHIHQCIERLLAQAFIHTALHNAKQSVRVFQTRKLCLAAFGPTQTHLHRRARFGLRGEVTFGFVRRAFIELHHDVAVQGGLNLHAHLRRHEQLVAIHRRRKGHPFFCDLAHRTQRPHLKTTTVGQDRFVPTLKAMQAAKALHHIQAGAHPQMKGVAQNDLCTHVFQAARHHPFDRAIGAHRHEDRCLHHTVVEGERAASRMRAQVAAII